MLNDAPTPGIEATNAQHAVHKLIVDSFLPLGLSAEVFRASLYFIVLLGAF